MVIIPAVDVLEGQCVRLLKGDRQRKMVYGDPAEWAERWIHQGATRLHIVDLDAAFSGRQAALGTLKAIASIDRSVEVQFGGGLRSLDAVEAALSNGAAWVVIGSAAAEPGFLEAAQESSGGRVLLGLDVRGEQLLTGGWTEQGGPFREVLEQALEAGVTTAVVTATSRDGTLQGPDLRVPLEVARMGASVIISGGVGSLDDIARVREAAAQHAGPGTFEGVIAGKALYDGRLDLARAINLLGLGQAGPGREVSRWRSRG